MSFFFCILAFSHLIVSEEGLITFIESGLPTHVLTQYIDLMDHLVDRTFHSFAYHSVLYMAI